MGTSGWQYGDWRPAFYPEGLGKARWLEHYAGAFETVEVNNAFYRLPEERTFAAWAARTPGGFTVAVKASRFLTHVRRLRQPEEPVARLVGRCAALGDKLGPVLLQLPPTLRRDLGALEATLAAFPAGTRVALEARHESWFEDGTATLLARFGAAWCLADTPGRRAPRWRTAPWGYLRFHAGRAQPPPCYGRRALERWAGFLAETWPGGGEVFAYFNNDANACALRDAVAFAAALRRAGARPTRVPPPRAVRPYRAGAA